MKRKTKRTMIFELILIIIAIAFVLLVIGLPKKEILGLTIKDSGLINTGDITAEVTEETDGKITGKIILVPEEEKKINITENKTYYGRKNE